MATPKTNAVRLLEVAGIAYSFIEYEVDLDDLAAESVALKVGLPAEQVFKTLVARGDKQGVCFAVIPGNTSLDLKALARMTGDHKVETVALKEVQPLTGYVRGGVTAIAAKKDFPVYLDETAILFDAITVSSGRRGCQILLSPENFVQATQARICPIAKLKKTEI